MLLVSGAGLICAQTAKRIKMFFWGIGAQKPTRGQIFINLSFILLQLQYEDFEARTVGLYNRNH